MPRLAGGGFMPQLRRVGAYLINDTFTTDLAAGSVNGTAAEPGPGRRMVTDTENKLSLSGGNATFAGGKTVAATGDPFIALTTQGRITGRVLRADLSLTATNKELFAGWWTTLAPSTGLHCNGIYFGGAATIQIRDTSSLTPDLCAYSSSTSYQFAIVLRSAGNYVFVKGGAFTNWTLLWITRNGNVATLYPGVASRSHAGTVALLRVPAALWLPTPLVSDGFSAWGTTDGLGHAEGVAGGLGAGGSGSAWTNAVGTWAVGGGAAAAATLSGGVAVATVDTGTADVIVTAKLTRAGGTAGVVCRWADANNHVQARHTGTNAQLAKVVGGVATTLVDAAATYVAGAEIRVICEGQKFRLYYNNALIGSEQTIADAALGSATLQGIRSTDTGNTFDDFTAYARGSGDEHNALDNF